MSRHSDITVRKHSFLSSTALGLSAVIITLTISCTVVAVYAIHLASEKSERVIALAQNAVSGLPEFQKALPPVLSDMLDDSRRPDYCGELGITAKVTSRPDTHGRAYTTIEVVNNGNKVVSLLSLRITVLDQHDYILTESQEWAATPFAADNEWRGPIMPGARRRFVSHRNLYNVGPMDEIRPEVEITELRVWNGPDDEDVLLQDTSTSETVVSVSTPADLPGNSEFSRGCTEVVN